MIEAISLFISGFTPFYIGRTFLKKFVKLRDEPDVIEDSKSLMRMYQFLGYFFMFVGTVWLFIAFFSILSKLKFGPLS